MKKTLTFLMILVAIILNAQEIQVVELEPFATLEEIIAESSALVKSKNYDDLYWSLNDSGDKAIIYPFHLDGSGWKAEWQKQYEGIFVADAVNIDWESMSIMEDGRLVIGACGNNGNARRDLSLYIIEEPYPEFTSQTRIAQQYRFSYPDQHTFPAESMDFDCEAVFTFKNDIYLLTKHRKDRFTKLYKLDNPNPNEKNVLKMLDKFEIGSLVTAAETNDDNTRLAVLTYESIWVFESDNDDFFNGKKYFLPIKAKQCEAICWDEDDILITNEQRDIYRVKLSELKEVK
jgi:hypothetical protein